MFFRSWSSGIQPDALPADLASRSSLRSWPLFSLPQGAPCMTGCAALRRRKAPVPLGAENRSPLHLRRCRQFSPGGLFQRPVHRDVWTVRGKSAETQTFFQIKAVQHGLHDHQFVPVPFSPGEIPAGQGRHQNEHRAWPWRVYSDFCDCHRGEKSRKTYGKPFLRPNLISAISATPGSACFAPGICFSLHG